MPLRQVENGQYTIDATGFGTSSFQRWYSFKHGKEVSSRKWVKCHFVAGTKTNVITSVKINSTPNRKGLVWKKLYHYFALHNEEFMAQYHARSNAESCVYMIKSKFGDAVRSKNWNSQVNEVLCKVIAHN